MLTRGKQVNAGHGGFIVLLLRKVVGFLAELIGFLGMLVFGAATSALCVLLLVQFSGKGHEQSIEIWAVLFSAPFALIGSAQIERWGRKLTGRRLPFAALGWDYYPPS